MLKFQFFSTIVLSILDRVAKLLYLPFGIKADRQDLDRYRQRGIDRYEVPEIYPLPPYDDPLY